MQNLNGVEQSNVRRIEWQKELIRRDVWQCCLNCGEWSDGAKPMIDDKKVYPMGCRLHKAFPPVEVIMCGCKDHMPDIPF